MAHRRSFVDIHCHVIPGLDDGARSWAESLEMARMAVEDGTRAIIATPHQLGNFAHVRGDRIRRAVAQLQQCYRQHAVDLTILPGADVRVESDLNEQLARRNVLTLGDHGRHVLLELPHELYLPLEACLGSLERMSIVGILSHPERNQGLLRKPGLVGRLVERGCLMQVTAGSLMGRFGPRCQAMAEQLVTSGWAHFIATDAHGSKTRRPLMGRAYARVAELVSEQVAEQLCCRNPDRVAQGHEVSIKVDLPPKPKSRWFALRKAA